MPYILHLLCTALHKPGRTAYKTYFLVTDWQRSYWQGLCMAMKRYHVQVIGGMR